MNIMDTSEICKTAENLAFLLREVCTQRGMVEGEIADLEREHNNIIHLLERNGCLYDERARLATQLARIRRKRRALKDWLKANDPYFKYLGGDNGKKIQNMIDNFVGIGRRVSP